MKRSEAVALGLAHYVADSPCKAGHANPRRQTVNGACMACARDLRARLANTARLAGAGWPVVSGPVQPQHADIARAVLMILRGSGREGDAAALRMLVRALQSAYAGTVGPHVDVPTC